MGSKNVEVFIALLYVHICMYMVPVRMMENGVNKLIESS